MFFIQSAAFFLSSIISLILIYFKVPIRNFQQIISLLLVILLILLIRFVFSKSKISLYQNVQIILLFLTSLLVQLLILSSGSFYGPLLILLHLYTLAIAFLLNIALSSTFLILSVSVLIGQILIDANMEALFKSDPATVILYGVSFLIIIPLGQYLVSTYKIKDKLYNILSEYLHLGKLREESILSSLNEIVFITDKALNILSISESVEKTLRFESSDIISKPLLSVLVLKDNKGELVLAEDLPIKSILEDKAVRLVKDLYLTTPIDNQQVRVILQIKPIIDSKNIVSQLVFIISEAKSYAEGDEHHSSLRQTLIKHENLLTDLKKSITDAKLPEFRKRIEVLNHIEEDLITTLELEDHPISQKATFEDVAYISKQALDSKQSFAQSLGVFLQFILPKAEASEASLLSLREKSLYKEMLEESNFSIPVDIRWLRLMIQKLIDLSILLSFDTKTRQVQLSVDHISNNVEIVIAVYDLEITQEQSKHLFLMHYQGLEGRAGLTLGSGLEGFIAKAVADRLSIPISIQSSNNKLLFAVKLSKKPRM